tara:strand:- start:59 stop:352 length:294 start_codon:yes stop_codon:yes gene_type:complete
MTRITNPDDIARYRLKALRAMIGLEVCGMTRGGTPATQIVREEFGITKRRKIDVYREFCRLTNQTPSPRICNTVSAGEALEEVLQEDREDNQEEHTQ